MLRQSRTSLLSRASYIAIGAIAVIAVSSASAAMAQSNPSAAEVAPNPQEPIPPATVPPVPGAPAAVSAQQLAVPNSPEIVITARRTNERLKDVPVAVTIFNTKALRELRIQTQTDLQLVTPGLVVRQTGSSDELNYSIRGQTIDAFSYSAPAVQTYFNEVPISGAAGSLLFDLQSIQVLKGPQGTLFGRNATGGAVLYSTLQPSLAKTSGYARAGYGNYNDRELEGALNLPLGEMFAVRVAGLVRKRQGFQNNLLDGSHPNSIDASAGRISILAEPSSRLTNVLVAQWGRSRGRTGAVKMQSANGVNGAPATYLDPITGTIKPLVTNFRDVYPAGVVTNNPQVNALFNGIGDFLTKQAQVGFYDVYSPRDQKRFGRQFFFSNTTSFAISDEVNLKNIVGRANSYLLEHTDISGAPYEFLRVGGGPGKKGTGYNFGNKQWSDEVQVNGHHGPFKWIVGAFYSTEKAYTYTPISITPDLGGPGFLGAYDFTLSDKSKAVYAQGTYALLPNLNFSAGARYTWEHVRLVQHADSFLFGFNDGDRRDKKPSWLIGVDYHPIPELMLYLTQRGSWRTGGFNGTSGANFPDAAPFKPETTYDFEGGAKFSGMLGSIRSTINLAVYDQHIKNVQRTTYFNLSALASNVNSARVTGFEVDSSFQLAPWLQTGGAFSYSNARYDDPRATVVGAQFIFGPYGDAPKYSGSAYVRGSTNLPNGKGELVLRADTYAQSHSYYSSLGNTLTPNTGLKGYGLFNARAEWNQVLGSRFGADIYVKNITQTHYSTGGFPLSPVTGSTGTLPGEPRTYGFDLRVDF